MPDEAEPHVRTWLALGPSETVWGRRLLPEVRRNLVSIAQAIARFEPVSALVRPAEVSLFAKQLSGHDVTLVPCEFDDIWIRDTGAVFVVGPAGRRGGVDFNFNGWGGKQDARLDAHVAAFIMEHAGVEPLQSELVIEGGALEVDGRGTAIITESCVLNDNRNPGWTKSQCEAELRRLLGIRKVIWLPGLRDFDITDGHTDFYARFCGPSAVLAAFDPDPESPDYAVTRAHLEILRAATDASGTALDVAVVEAPKRVRPQFAGDDFAAGYVNYYVCNGAVIAPQFGDAAADQAAVAALRRSYPNREVVQLAIDGIAAGGGGIHCVTQQEPKPQHPAKEGR